MEYEKGRYMVEVIGLPPEASWEEVYQFFINCGNIRNLEISRFGYRTFLEILSSIFNMLNA